MASFAVRGSIAASLGGTSIYGPLSAPIVLLIWLYLLAISVLIGAALNAAIRNLWPSAEQRGCGSASPAGSGHGGTAERSTSNPGRRGEWTTTRSAAAATPRTTWISTAYDRLRGAP